MHCTGIGKAMLADLSEGKVYRYMEKDLTVYTIIQLQMSKAKRRLEVTKTGVCD